MTNGLSGIQISDLEEAYFAALDEIYRLRRALAYEALVIAAHTGYATFPKSRRAIAHEQIRRMQAAARGEAQKAYAGTSDQSLRSGLREAGANQTLTRHEWESSLPKRGVSS